MPRENRKRGKKHKNKATEEVPSHEPSHSEPEPQVGPSWIISAPGEGSEFNPEVPFGYVDADVKAYFRTVDIQIRDWQEAADAPVDEDGTVDPNAEKHMFFVAALNEMREKEKQLATDPDCSIILERMAFSMDDFVRRVFLDSLSGSYETLAKHRFASHVCQTLLTVAAETMGREAKGVVAQAPEDSDGELRTVTDLVLDICQELLPSFSSLVMDPYASHVIRALLGLLCPSSKHSSSHESSQGAVRSKKSAHWKSRQGPLTSVFDVEKRNDKETTNTQISPKLRAMSRTFVETMRNKLGDNEVRALAADKVASPCLLMLLDVEVELEMADERGSLMDRVTVGIVSASLDGDMSVEPSDYLGTLFRDPTSSHLLETIISRASDAPFALIWNTYLKGRLSRLAIHPVSNFVVAKVIERTDASQLATTYDELENVWQKMITTSRTGVLRSTIDRSVALRTLEHNAIEAAFSSLDLVSDEDRLCLVPCMLSLHTLQTYKSMKSTEPSESNPQKNGKMEGKRSSSQTNVQGSLLLQSLLKLSHPHNQPVINSLNSLDSSERLKIAHNATSSRVLDILLDSETVPGKAKRAFVQSFCGSYHLLVDDRIGSRVGDRCFAFADTYLKEKVARSLISQEQFLAGSYYGKFFCRNLNLYLLKSRPDEWKTFQSNKKKGITNSAASTSNNNSIGTRTSILDGEPPNGLPSKKKRKRETRAKDEIDELFDHVQLNKRSKGDKATAATPPTNYALDAISTKQSADRSVDNELKDVFSAIRDAPKGDKKTKGLSGKNKQ
ncbi:armadillo-type protein [Rhodocollybia butyracea]|uniref:Nucleolar protein 9 n=1 Tax=Rhodocollybia butyracea TaxID=206335 RepID=A0A9P5Q702_9AGAR|nr:armadillo-type protein [Rhodocollybia butyracea]